VTKHCTTFLMMMKERLGYTVRHGVPVMETVKNVYEM
jgi:hypothetical protein